MGVGTRFIASPPPVGRDKSGPYAHPPHLLGTHKGMPLLKMGTHKGCPYTSYVCLKSCYRGSIWRRVSARGSDLLFDTKKQQDGRMLLFRVKKNGVVRRAEELQIPLMDCNINTSPIIQGNFKPRAIRYAVYIGFAQEGSLY